MHLFSNNQNILLGGRFGKLQVKAGLVTMLRKFRYELDDRHIGKEMEYSPQTFVIAPRNKIYLRVFRR